MNEQQFLSAVCHEVGVDLGAMYSEIPADTHFVTSGTDAKAESEVVARLTAIVNANREAEARAAAHAAAVAERDRLKGELDRLRDVMSSNGTTVDPATLRDRADILSERLDLQVRAGNLTPAMATTLKGLMFAEDGRPIGAMFRRLPGGDVLMARVLDCFSGHKLGIRTGEITKTSTWRSE